MPVKVVFKGAKERDFFVVADPDMLKEWRDDYFVPLEVALTARTPIFYVSQDNGARKRHAYPHDIGISETFNTMDPYKVVEKILEDGKIKEAKVE